MSDVGSPKQGLMNIGEEAKPPFAVLPTPSTMFLARAKRFDTLAAGHDLAPYLRFLGTIARAQHDILPNLPDAPLPQSAQDRVSAQRAVPLPHASYQCDGVATATLSELLDRLAGEVMPAEAAAAVASLRSAADVDQRRLADAVLREAGMTEVDMAQRVLVAAGLQVHFARLAGRLDAGGLQPVGDGVCPTCASPPATSSVVGWPGAHNTRFCSCSLCGSMWNVVRIKCVLCSRTGGISYHTIEGSSGHVKAEACESCRAYVKVLYEVNDPLLEPIADDVATLGLDMLMAEDGWRRGGRNPFLSGY